MKVKDDFINQIEYLKSKRNSVFLTVILVLVSLFLGNFSSKWYTIEQIQVYGLTVKLNVNEKGNKDYQFKSQKKNGSIYWIDNMSKNSISTENFYKDLFHWDAMSTNNDPKYKYFVDNEDLKGGLYNETVPGFLSYWRIYFLVDDLDKFRNNAIILGAEQLLGKTHSDADNGIDFCVLKDPGGAVFALIEKK
jgi:predicted enzyme related to lactoylglutathione lyase